MDARQLDVEGREVPATAVGAPVPAPLLRPVLLTPPAVLPPAPVPVVGQTDLDLALGVDALFPYPPAVEDAPQR